MTTELKPLVHLECLIEEICPDTDSVYMRVHDITQTSEHPEEYQGIFPLIFFNEADRKKITDNTFNIIVDIKIYNELSGEKRKVVAIRERWRSLSKEEQEKADQKAEAWYQALNQKRP